MTQVSADAPMRVRGIHRTAVAIPAKHRIVSSVRDTDQVINVLVEVETEEGVTGVSYVAGFTRNKAIALCALLDDLGEVIRGQDATQIGALWDEMWTRCTLAGHTGLAAFALSAVDTALWDLQGKLLGAPLHRLLGTRRRRLAAYASEGCWLQQEPVRVAEEALAFVALGFKAVKIRFGRRDPVLDLAVLDTVRRAVGDDVSLMVDVNQGWSRELARRYGRRLADYNIEWLEEPLPAEDIEGLAALRRELPFPITAGENAYMPDGIRALVEARAVSVLMPDLQRVGGVTGWVRANALAEAWRLPITSHLFPEISVHLLAASQMAGPLEWVTWMEPLVEEPLEVRDGAVKVPERPGLGISFDQDAVRRHRLE